MIPSLMLKLKYTWICRPMKVLENSIIIMKLSIQRNALKLTKSSEESIKRIFNFSSTRMCIIIYLSVCMPFHAFANCLFTYSYISYGCVVFPPILFLVSDYKTMHLSNLCQSFFSGQMGKFYST